MDNCQWYLCEATSRSMPKEWRFRNLRGLLQATLNISMALITTLDCDRHSLCKMHLLEGGLDKGGDRTRF